MGSQWSSMAGFYTKRKAQGNGLKPSCFTLRHAPLLLDFDFDFDPSPNRFIKALK